MMFQSSTFFKLVVTFFLCSFPLYAQAENPSTEISTAAPVDAEPAPKVCSRNYDYSAPGVIAQIKEECGIPFVENYDFKGCIPLSAKDHCLPSGFINAVEKGGAHEKFWQAEIWVSNEKKEMDADRLLRSLMAKYPKSPKPKWLFAKNMFFRTERMDEKAVDAKHVLLTEGWDAAKDCVKVAPNNINCLLHMGTLMGRWGTNQGIVKVLRNGDEVEKAWLDAAATKQHYRFPSANTSLGATYYGLGIFYRLVPDSWIFNLFFGYRGNIKKTVQYLNRSFATKNNQIEIHTELAAANYCQYTRDDDNAALKAGHTFVKKCKALKPAGELDVISQTDCGKLKANPDLGCGYSRDRQQETDVEKLKEAHEKE